MDINSAADLLLASTIVLSNDEILHKHRSDKIKRRKSFLSDKYREELFPEATGEKSVTFFLLFTSETTNHGITFLGNDTKNGIFFPRSDK